MMYENNNPYGFRRASIRIVPERDNDIFLVKHKLAEDLVNFIKSAISSDHPFSIVIDGAPGIGKTQLLYYIANQVKEICFPLYVCVPDSFPKGGYLDLHEAIMYKIGSDRLKKIFIKVIQTKLLNFPEEISTRKISPSEISFTNEFLKITEGKISEDNWCAFHSFITGNRISQKEMRILNLTKEQISEENAVEILNDIARALKIINSKPLLLLIDEMDHFDTLKDNFIGKLRHAIRGLAESTDLGKIFAFTGRAQERLFMNDPTVARRITKSVTIPEYTPEELLLFLKEQIQYFRLKNFDPTPYIKKIEGISERITVESYPFTEEALESIVKKVEEAKANGYLENLRPSEPMELAAQTVIHGYYCKRPYLDTSDVEASL
ncbi:MAG: P-loop NTPase fold protein [Candidatus Bathyarchaeia archaeon]|uniref:P-loop NTPase fold protein n=1 Tax=Candidatus Hadarchaeum sp. TaxID=2883567 RepID=UPI003179047F